MPKKELYIHTLARCQECDSRLKVTFMNTKTICDLKFNWICRECKKVNVADFPFPLTTK